MIKNILEIHGITNLDSDLNRDKMVMLLKDDNLLFKRIVSFLLHDELEKFFNKQISSKNRIEDLIPRFRRPALVYQLESHLNIDFPKMTLSKRRIKLILLLYALCFIFITSLNIVFGNFSLFPYLFLYLALIVTVPAVILGLISLFRPRFFAPLDWDDILIFEDLLYRLVLDNYNLFSEGNYSRTVAEIANTLNSKSHGSQTSNG